MYLAPFKRYKNNEAQIKLKYIACGILFEYALYECARERKEGVERGKAFWIHAFWTSDGKAQKLATVFFGSTNSSSSSKTSINPTTIWMRVCASFVWWRCASIINYGRIFCASFPNFRAHIGCGWIFSVCNRQFWEICRMCERQRSWRVRCD